MKIHVGSPPGEHQMELALSKIKQHKDTRFEARVFHFAINLMTRPGMRGHFQLSNQSRLGA
jgi:hypothetical protein